MQIHAGTDKIMNTGTLDKQIKDTDTEEVGGAPTYTVRQVYFHVSNGCTYEIMISLYWTTVALFFVFFNHQSLYTNMYLHIIVVTTKTYFRLARVLILSQVDPRDRAEWSEELLQIRLPRVLRQVGHTDCSVVIRWTKTSE